MTFITADILVNGEEHRLLDNHHFQCRDTLIPQIYRRMQLLHNEGKKLAVSREQHFHLETSNRRPSSWDDIMGNNANVSPMASPFLLRFYIGRVRNGYQYAKLERALWIAGEKKIPFPSIATAWNLGDHYYQGLGLGNILPTVRAWDYGSLDYEKIFPPYKFIS